MQRSTASLFSEPPARRSRATRRWIHTRLREIVPASETQAALCTAVLCTEIDLLFEPTLQLDPLKLLRDASRATCTVDELQRRFSDFVRHNMRGHDRSNTRLTLSVNVEFQRVLTL